MEGYEAYMAFLSGEQCLFPGLSLTALLSSPSPSAPALVSMEESQRPCKRSRTAAMVPRGSVLARERRQRLSEKMRCLQRLVPWDKKMDMTTMLEETYKYVKFLQAQLSALSAMPHHSGHSSVIPIRSSFFFGGLERLSSAQLLQVLVNSPVVQTLLYSKGFCVFSIHNLPLPASNNLLLPFPF